MPHWQPASVVFKNASECLCYVVCVLRLINIVVVVVVRCLQCFDTVGWVAGRASGL